MYGTIWALLPPIIAIALALITKEVYSSLFLGILVGGLLVANFSPVGALDTIINDGLISGVADAWNVGIFLFLILLGIIVALMNSAGGSAAFGRWAESHVKTRVGAMLATILLGVLIFVDDYFNCLTVGSVMRPVTDGHRISRAKLAFIIDATAAPICMIAPISSWAAAVSGIVDEGVMSGTELFVRAIPWNYYSLLTIVFLLGLTLMKFDYGPMRLHEMNAQLNGDLFTTGESSNTADEVASNPRSRVIDLLLPVVVLIVCCVLGMLYVGGFFSGVPFAEAFADTDASVGLPWGSMIALLFTLLYFFCRRLLTFKQAMGCITKGFIAMVPALLILTFAVTLKNITGMLGAADYVYGVMESASAGLYNLLPAIIFHQGLPRGQHAADHRRVRVPGRRGHGRPLLADLRYLDHGLGRRPVRPHLPHLHPAALCADRGSRELCELSHRRLCAERRRLPRDRHRADGRNALCPSPRRGAKERRGVSTVSGL